MSVKSIIAAGLALPLVSAALPDAVSVVTTDAVAAPVHPWAATCKEGSEGSEGDRAGPPFRILGNTYYAGTCGISAILITTDHGHALIDSGTQACAGVVLPSHEHSDHVGGMAKLQAATDAIFASSAMAVGTMITGEAQPCDILLTPHPAGRNLPLTLSLIERRAHDGLPKIACARYASTQKQALSLRLSNKFARK